MSSVVRRIVLAVVLWTCVLSARLSAEQVIEHPFLGITHITRTETSPRNLRMHVVQIDLTVPGIRFQLTPSGGSLEAVRRTTLEFLNQTLAQVAINSHFFLPFPSSSPDAMLIGLAASSGNVYSAFESPVQSYAIVTDAPAVNIDPMNNAGIVHRDPSLPSGKNVVENVTLWNALAGSAQIVTNGVKSIPTYKDAQNPDGLLTPGGPANYSNTNSWYNLINARTAIGLTQDNGTVVLFAVDRAGGSAGMSVGEVADLLINDYHVYNALNLDGGGSTTLAMQDPVTSLRKIVNVSSDNPAGRSVGSNLAIFAALDTIPPTTTAALSPNPNANGWHKANAALTLTAVDNRGGGVRNVEYIVTGAEATGPHTVAGSTASQLFTAEGTTNVSYFASDYSGNIESARSLSVQIDKTAPVIMGMPDANCVLWPPNQEMVEVAIVAAMDALSGISSDGLQLTVASNEPSDPAHPDFEIVPAGPAQFKVLLRAHREGTGAGRIYTLTATARDQADNVKTMNAICKVPHDQRGRR